jgi:hypothetical protein
MDWILEFGQKVLAIPGLHAILAAWAAGCAMTYLCTLPMPAWTPIQTAVHYNRVLVFFTVMGTALALLPTPVMFAWAFTVAILTPASYEMATKALFLKWPALKPKALMTENELINRDLAKCGK